MNESTRNIIKKLTKSDKKGLLGKVVKTQEELGELSKLVLPFESQFATNHRFVNKNDILDEVADLLLCVYSIGYGLDFSDEDIESKVIEKSKKWSELQNREVNAKFPVPFEIHVTVDATQKDFDVEHFRNVCKLIDVKPIVLDLQKGSLTDVMTSSVIIADNRGAYNELERIVKKLKTAHFSVVREKIESVPHHPSAPSNTYLEPHMPQGSYFETHFNILVRTKEEALLVEEVKKQFDCHLSKNKYKVHEDGTYNQMMTYRSYDKVREDFLEEIERIRQALLQAKLEIEKVIVEFTVYDTKTSHDNAWLRG
jgi:hypothetical protein